MRCCAANCCTSTTCVFDFQAILHSLLMDLTRVTRMGINLETLMGLDVNLGKWDRFIGKTPEI